MYFYLTVKQLDPEYSQAFADEHDGGKESEINTRYEWEDEIKVSEDVLGFEVKEKGVFTLQGALPNGEEFSYDIPNMRVCECLTESENNVSFAMSESMIHDTHQSHDERTETARFYYFIKAEADYYNPIPGVYIATEDFPEALREE